MIKMDNETYVIIELVCIHGLKDKVKGEKHDFYLDVDLLVNNEALFEHVPIHFEDLFCDKRAYDSLVQLFYIGVDDVEEYDARDAIYDILEKFIVGEVLFEGSFIKNDIIYCCSPLLLPTMEIIYQKYFLNDEAKAPKEYTLVEYEDWKNFKNADFDKQQQYIKKWKTVISSALFNTNNLDEVLS